MNNVVIAYYEHWKTEYLTQSGDFYYNNHHVTNFDTTSEATAYGMIITALMAGYDPNAKNYFDGFKALFDSHRSRTDGNLMSWQWPLRDNCAKDWAHNQSNDAKAILTKMLTWLKPATNNNPANIASTYDLDGTVVASEFSGAFAAPFVAACISDPAHQQYLNDGWDIISTTHESYYPDNLTLMSMLLISGNFWEPTVEAVPTPISTETPLPTPTPTPVETPTPTPQAHLCGDVNDDGEVSLVDALMIAQCYVGQRICPEEDMSFIDVNGDMEISIVDALMIAQYYVGIRAQLNCAQ